MSVAEHPADARPQDDGKLLLESFAAFPATIVLLISMIAVLNAIQPTGAERATASLGLWTFAKLMLAFCVSIIGGWGFINSRRVRAVLASPPGLLLALIAVVFLAASVFAYPETAMISRAAALILVGYLLFTVTALCTVGPRVITSAAVIGSTMFMLIAWVLYLFVPSLGRFTEYADQYTTVMRMGGITHPNPLAREAAICGLLCLSMLRTGAIRVNKPKLRFFLISVIGLSLMTLAATMSRTALLAGFAATLALMFDKLFTRRAAVLFLGCVSLMIAGFFVLVLSHGGDSIAETALGATTKSGDIKELTSATGRTVIWAEAWRLICERPILGWGLDSAASVMTEESNSTHNLLLHTTFSGGFPAGILTIILLALTLYHATTSTEPLFRGIATYVLISGLVEDTLFESFPSVLTILWITVLLMPVAKAYQARTGPSQQLSAN